MAGSSSSRRRRRLWRFGGAEFDEASWTLKVDGAPVTLEGKPLEVLHELLLRAGEVVTKDEILDAVWPGVTVVEGSLPTAISKLRKALGERQDNIIETVPRVGYRLTCSVRIESVESPLAPRFSFAPGDLVPGRRQWRLVAPLGDTGAQDVWLAAHDKTGERRVFKFADAPDRLRALKREAALSRVVFAGLGDRAPLPALLEWNFEASPYFLEYTHGGSDLTAWAEAAGGLGQIALADRLAVAARIARALAAVHSLGVLHKDLKPANILIDAGKVGDPAVRLADFGSGRLLDDAVLDDYGITNPGLLDAAAGADDPRSGTLAYRAPELAGDALPTIKSDIYALGLILYQLVAGDFAKGLAPGWEGNVADPLLREDIRQAAAGEPARRLASAEELAQRIETLTERRAAAEAAQAQTARLAEQKEAEARRLQRRPWVRAAAASLIIGLIASSGFAAYAWSQRNEALAAQQLSQASYRFLAEDVLGSVDPTKANGADETLAEAMKRASANVDRRYAGQPEIAARLHQSLARAFYGRADFDTARAEFAHSEAQFRQSGEMDSDDAVLGRLALAHMNAVSGQPEMLAEAGRMLTRERERLGPRADRGKVGFAMAQAEGAHAYMADIAKAEDAFQRGLAIARDDPAAADPDKVLKLKSSLVLTLLRLGKPEQAEPLAREVVRQSGQLRGSSHPDTLVARQHWLTSLGFLGRHEEVVRGSAPLLQQLARSFGPDHRYTLALRSTRFESLAALGRYDEAAQQAQLVWKGATSQAGALSHQALVGQSDYGSTLCLTSRRTEGLAITQAALDAARKAFGADYPLVDAIRYFAGECLIANHRYAEAAAALRLVNRDRATDLLGQSDFGALVDLALAEIALGQHDPVRARALLDKVGTMLDSTQDQFVRNRLASIRRALVS